MGNTCGAGSVEAGTVLDRVISQASNKDDCLLYRLANYKKGGELIDAYNTGGQSEVEKLIKEQFGVLMYNEGKGTVINRAEYLRWKFRDMQQVQIPIEASLSSQDPLSKWEDHQACWQMQYRGSLGETLLHVLIICDTKIHTKLARTLLKCFPRLSIDVVEGEEYLGASALHLAIAYFNNELVQDLVEAGANVEQRAIGSFFLPRDQQGRKPVKNTDYEGLAYLGEYPLAWAACCANESVYNLLLENNAHPDRQDSFGNMILHMVVICDKLDMFGYALRHPKTPASNGKINEAGLTPLTLACKLGRAMVFREMLELSSREFWRYSNITCSAYPLNALDTILPDGRTNWNSALVIILNGTKEEHLDMLDGGIIQRLLEEKWKTFARRQFLKRLAVLMLHLMSLSAAVFLRPTDKKKSLLEITTLQDCLRVGFETLTTLGVLSYLIVQQGGEIQNQGFVYFIKQLDPAKAIFLVSNILLLACIPFRLLGDVRTEEAILVFAVPGSWFLLMFFAGAVRLTGPFVTMVYSMIIGDMFTFAIIYMIVLFGFSQSFYFLYKGFPGVKNTLYNSYPSTWMALFQITLGDYNYAELSHTSYPMLSKTVFTIFMILVPILLLNMLIAMMGNTYAHVIEQSEKEWMKQWAKIVVSLERAVNQEDAKRYLQEYSIRLGPGDDPSTEQRGVMVIKSKSKTRAKQRKGAVANWKRVGKVTINELRKRNMTGEQLRRIMWDRASISTPVKLPKNVALDVLAEPVPEPPTSSPSVGFGGALTAAIDVMAFTHDLDLTGTTGASRDEIVSDPFRDLVLSAEIDAEDDTLIILAEAAASSVDGDKIKAEEMARDFKLARQMSVEQSAALIASDSDILAEELPLGHGPRARKIKSAQQRQKAENGVSVKGASVRHHLLQNGIGGSSTSGSSSVDWDLPPPYSSLSLGPPSLSSKPLIKRKSTKRAKTAKPNRVAPAPELPLRPGSSAIQGESPKPPASPPDPLEPWSTRGITNMNAILAWEPSDQDSM